MVCALQVDSEGVKLTLLRAFLRFSPMRMFKKSSEILALPLTSRPQVPWNACLERWYRTSWSPCTTDVSEVCNKNLWLGMVLVCCSHIVLRLEILTYSSKGNIIVVGVWWVYSYSSSPRFLRLYIIRPLDWQVFLLAQFRIDLILLSTEFSRCCNFVSCIQVISGESI